jgi:HD-GYP domain-containing protein (c-di-GMP phosphodiesterase class II)
VLIRLRVGPGIVAVVDVFDALTHPRPYREAGSVDRATQEIRRESGSHFDPDVVAWATSQENLARVRAAGARKP